MPRFRKLVEHLVELHTGEAVLLGSAAMAIRGLRDVYDLDVLVRTLAFNQLLLSSRSLHPVSLVFGDVRTDRPERLHFSTPSGRISIVDKLHDAAATTGVTVKQVWARAEAFSPPLPNQLVVLDIQHLHQFKAAAGREKDRDDIALIAMYQQEKGTTP